WTGSAAACGPPDLGWWCAVSGALLVILADSIGRLAFLPLQLPAGIIISLIGGPFFLLLLWQRRNSF
ncbi:iron chelate uptake ABC transporter family permease subunit, partial [Pseudomonas aeruginosa]|uniref:iron chelate uptake ABC transporter family permease subunit n=1 Tax=Pseudomonas aeruginosa TaxID=287 RepID=UPI0031B7393F